MRRSLLALMLPLAACGAEARTSEGALFTIDGRGGQVQSSDGKLVLEVPAGALDRPISIRVTTRQGFDLSLLDSLVYGIEPTSLMAMRPMHLTVQGEASEVLSVVGIEQYTIRPLPPDEGVQVVGRGATLISKLGLFAAARATPLGSPCPLQVPVGGTPCLAVQGQAQCEVGDVCCCQACHGANFLRCDGGRWSVQHNEICATSTCGD